MASAAKCQSGSLISVTLRARKDTETCMGGGGLCIDKVEATAEDDEDDDEEDDEEEEEDAITAARALDMGSEAVSRCGGAIQKGGADIEEGPSPPPPSRGNDSLLTKLLMLLLLLLLYLAGLAATCPEMARDTRSALSNDGTTLRRNSEGCLEARSRSKSRACCMVSGE